MSDKDEIKIKVFSGLIWRFGERFTAQIVTFVVSIVLARILTPEDYGKIALILVFINIADVFVNAGFGSALIQKKDSDKEDFSSVFFFNLLFSTFVYITLFILAPILADFYKMSDIGLVSRILSVRIIIAAINGVQQAYVSKEMLFKRFFVSTFFGTIISAFLGIFFALQGFGIWALVIQYLSNTLIDTLVLWFTVRWRPIMYFSMHKIIDLLSFGWKMLISGLLDTGYSQLRNLLIGKVYNSESLAFYNRGEQFPAIVVTNINTSISSVLFPAISKCQDDIEQVKRMTRRSVRISSYIMWPLMIGLTVIAKPLVLLILTDKWIKCIPFLCIACINYAFYPIHTANLEALKAIGRSDLFLRLEIIKKIIGVITIIVSIKFGIYAIAISQILLSILCIFINAFPNRKLIGYDILEQLSDIFGPFICSSIMGFIIYFIRFLNINNLLLIILQVTIGGIIYLVLTRITNNESLDYLLSCVGTLFINKRKI